MKAFLVSLLVVTLALVACGARENAPTPVTVEREPAITRQVETPAPVEVIREVEVPVEVEVIREVEVPVEVEVIREIEVPGEVQVPVVEEIIREVPVEVFKERPAPTGTPYPTPTPRPTYTPYPTPTPPPEHFRYLRCHADHWVKRAPEATENAAFFNECAAATLDTFDWLATSAAVERRQVTLPQTGDVMFLIARGAAGGADIAPFAMDTLEQAARAVEDYLGIAYPVNTIRLVFVPPTDEYAGAFHHGYMVVNSHCAAHQYCLEITLTHELTHYHFNSTSMLLREGTAVFVEDYLRYQRHGAERGLALGPVINAGQPECDGYQRIGAWLASDQSDLQCAYYFGHVLFYQLYQDLDEREFIAGLQRLNQIVLDSPVNIIHGHHKIYGNLPPTTPLPAVRAAFPSERAQQTISSLW